MNTGYVFHVVHIINMADNHWHDLHSMVNYDKNKKP